MAELSSQSSNTEEGETAGHSTPTELEIVDGPKKGRLRGLGSQGSYRSGSSSSTFRFNAQNWQAEKTELLNRVEGYEAEMQQLYQSYSKQQDEIEFLKSQFAIFQQQMGGSSHYPRSSRPPNPGRAYSSYNQSRVSKFMPTPGGSPAPAPPPYLPSEEPNDDDDDDNGE